MRVSYEFAPEYAFESMWGNGGIAPLITSRVSRREE